MSSSIALLGLRVLEIESPFYGQVLREILRSLSDLIDAKLSGCIPHVLKGCVIGELRNRLSQMFVQGIAPFKADTAIFIAFTVIKPRLFHSYHPYIQRKLSRPKRNA